MIVDIHTHLLYGLDDGPKTLEATIEMARTFVATGTHAVFVTPHAYSRLYHADAPTIVERAADLQRELNRLSIPLLLRPGMEVHKHAQLVDHLLSGEALNPGGGKQVNAVLLELSTREWPSDLLDVLYELRIRHIVPIIAHPERYLKLQKDPGYAEQLVKEGARLQITAGAITGQMGRLQEKLCRNWLRQGWIHYVASDAHDSVMRKPGLRDAYERIRHEWALSEQADACIARAHALWLQ